MGNEEYYRRQREQKKKQRQAELRFRLAVSIVALAVILIVTLVAVLTRLNRSGGKYAGKSGMESTEEKYIEQQPDLVVDLLTVNKYSRPGTKLEKVNGIVVHWTANPGTTAQQNRSYFEGLATSHITFASSHFVIGLEGEIVQCIPCSEISYASNDRNSDTLAVECCVEDLEGKFNRKTYQSLVELVAWLMGRYHLSSEDVIRHYDVTGKDCPKYYVNNPEEWERFHRDLEAYIEKNGVPGT